MNFNLRIPGLFITSTDTGVGKTTITCAIAAALRRNGAKVAVCKPIATGCRLERETLISADAEALAHFADCRAALPVINPVRYHAPLAPAVAAEKTGRPIDFNLIGESLERLQDDADVLLVEGIGGLLVPLDERRTVLDLAKAIGYPAVVVTRHNLGTLNHTAMTCQLIRHAGLKLAGLVINQYRIDDADPSVASNPVWLARQNHTRVLATVPAAKNVVPEKGELPLEVLDAVAVLDWSDVCHPVMGG